MDSQQFEIGDHVFVGAPSPNKVHWVIQALPKDRPATLVSPMSGRRTSVYPMFLTLHSRKDAA